MRAAPVLAMTAFLLGSGCRTDRRPGEAPDISLKTYGGEAYSVTARDGLVTLLVFWATWCRPCIMEIPTLMELHEKYRGRGFRVVAVNVDDPEGTQARRIEKHFGVNYPSLIGTDQTSRDFGGVHALPTSFIIGRDGKLKEKIQGMLHPLALEAKIVAEL